MMRLPTHFWHHLPTPLLLVALALPAHGLAQTADTTAAWRYVPLQVGNEWHTLGSHNNGYWVEYTQIRRRVVGEQTDAPGRFVVETTSMWWRDGFPPAVWTGTAEWFYDEHTQRVVGADTPCPLGAPFDTQVVCDYDLTYDVSGGHAQTVNIGTQQVVTTRKMFSHQTGGGAFSLSYQFAAGIGPLAYNRFQAGTGNHEITSWTLRYARIGQQEFGQPLSFPVSTEEMAAAGAPVISATPNPSRDVLTLRYELRSPERARITLFDLLGREVYRRALADQAAGPTEMLIDVSRLPTGRYIVQLETGSGVLTTSATVVR